MSFIARAALGRWGAPNNCNVAAVSVRGMMSKSLMNQLPPEDRPKRPPPYPYRASRFHTLKYWFNLGKTIKFFNENTKVIVIDGPVAAGKTKLARKLADEFDLYYLPAANLDMIYYTNAGFDLRSLDDQMPDSYKSFDVNNFLMTPKHIQTAYFQFMQFRVKSSQYIDALAHLFNTGQGVILDRSVYSDFVFMEAMYNAGYVSKKAYKAYYIVRNIAMQYLIRPHLVIYLDMPVDKVMENVRKRNISFEVNSPVMNPTYLGCMEKHYKQNYLKAINQHAELLVYDWSQDDDPEMVIEDIEHIDFNKPTFTDWIFSTNNEFDYMRFLYTHLKLRFLQRTNLPLFDVPELTAEPEDSKIYYDLMAQAPGNRYALGYDKSLGDTGMLIKRSLQRETLPLRESRWFK